jgi:hypothetical protein
MPRLRSKRWPPDESVVQLCDIEAMQQIHKWKATLRPDNLVAYAMVEPKVSQCEITADGAAFRARKRWYLVRYKCNADAELNNVQSFEFSVGEEIPKAEWGSHYLTEDDGPPDCVWRAGYTWCTKASRGSAVTRIESRQAYRTLQATVRQLLHLGNGWGDEECFLREYDVRTRCRNNVCYQ